VIVRAVTNFPNLSRMALDILLIPTMLADPKRLFLGAKITILDGQDRLGICTIKALECLKSWLDIKAIEEDAVDEDLHIGHNSDL
jgi:hAT family C-terminal dimerisation region